MGFGEIFGKSWQEYKKNFKQIFEFMFLFYGIPQLIVGVISLFSGFFRWKRETACFEFIEFNWRNFFFSDVLYPLYFS